MIEKAPKLKFNEHFLSVINFIQSGKKLKTLNKIENRYLYWDKIKYIKDPYFDSKKLWMLTKSSRELQYNHTSIDNIKYLFNITTDLQQKLHYLDHNFGAGLQKEQLLSELDKQQYLNNALMEESIFSSMIEGATTTRVQAKDMLRKNKPLWIGNP